GLLTMGDLQPVPIWAEATRRVRERFASLDDTELRRAVVHELIDWQVSDLLINTRSQIESADVSTISDVRAAPVLAQQSAEMNQLKREFELVLAERVYRHPQVLRFRQHVQEQL